MSGSSRRVCLFTGISGTLGRDFAARYADTYDLVGVYNSNVPESPMTDLDHGDIGGTGSYFGVQCDLADEGALDDLVARVVNRLGPVDLLVNAAVYRRFGPITSEAFARSLEWQFLINVCLPLELTSVVARRVWQDDPDINRERGRSVVNLSSTAGHTFYPEQGQIGYGASKAAIDLATVHLANELAPIGVRANAIAPNTFPGLVSTEAVSRAIHRYDSSTGSGEIFVMDTDGEHLLGEVSRTP